MTQTVKYSLPKNRCLHNVRGEDGKLPMPNLPEGLRLPYRFSEGKQKGRIVQDLIEYEAHYTEEAARLAVKRAKRFVRNYRDGDTPPAHIGLALKLWTQVNREEALLALGSIAAKVKVDA